MSNPPLAIAMPVAPGVSQSAPTPPATLEQAQQQIKQLRTQLSQQTEENTMLRSMHNELQASYAATSGELSSVKSSSVSAAEHDKLKDELAKIKSLAAQYVQKAKKEAALYTQKISTLEAERAATESAQREQIAALTAQIQAAPTAVANGADAESAIAAVRSELSSLAKAAEEEKARLSADLAKKSALVKKAQDEYLRKMSLMEEMKRESAERDGKAAEEIRRLTTQLESVQSELATAKLSSSTLDNDERVTAAMQHSAGLEAKYNEANERQFRLKTQLDEALAERQSAQQQIFSLQEQMTDLRSEISELNQTKANSDGLAKKCAELESKLSQTISTNQQAATAHNTELATLRHQHESVLKEERDKRTRVEATLNQTTQQLNDAMSQYNAIKASATEHKQKLESALKGVDDAGRSEKERLISDLNKVRSDASVLANNTVLLNDRVASLTSQLTESHRRLEIEQTKTGMVETELRQVQRKVDTLIIQIKDRNDEINLLQKQNEQTVKLYGETIASMDSKQHIMQSSIDTLTAEVSRLTPLEAKAQEVNTLKRKEQTLTATLKQRDDEIEQLKTALKVKDDSVAAIKQSSEQHFNTRIATYEQKFKEGVAKQAELSVTIARLQPIEEEYRVLKGREDALHEEMRRMRIYAEELEVASQSAQAALDEAAVQRYESQIAALRKEIDDLERERAHRNDHNGILKTPPPYINTHSLHFYSPNMTSPPVVTPGTNGRSQSPSAISSSQLNTAAESIKSDRQRQNFAKSELIKLVSRLEKCESELNAERTRNKMAAAQSRARIAYLESMLSMEGREEEIKQPSPTDPAPLRLERLHSSNSSSQLADADGDDEFVIHRRESSITERTATPPLADATGNAIRRAGDGDDEEDADVIAVAERETNKRIGSINTRIKDMIAIIGAVNKLVNKAVTQQQSVVVETSEDDSADSGVDGSDKSKSRQSSDDALSAIIEHCTTLTRHATLISADLSTLSDVFNGVYQFQSKLEAYLQDFALRSNASTGWIGPTGADCLTGFRLMLFACIGTCPSVFVTRLAPALGVRMPPSSRSVGNRAARRNDTRQRNANSDYRYESVQT